MPCLPAVGPASFWLEPMTSFTWIVWKHEQPNILRARSAPLVILAGSGPGPLIAMARLRPSRPGFWPVIARKLPARARGSCAGWRRRSAGIWLRMSPDFWLDRLIRRHHRVSTTARRPERGLRIWSAWQLGSKPRPRLRFPQPRLAFLPPLRPSARQERPGNTSWRPGQLNVGRLCGLPGSMAATVSASMGTDGFMWWSNPPSPGIGWQAAASIRTGVPRLLRGPMGLFSL